MTFAILAALSLPVGAAALLVWAAWPSGRPLRSQALLKLALALGGGLGLSSCSYFLSLVLFNGGVRGLALCDAALSMTALTAFVIARRQPVPAGEPRVAAQRFAIHWLLPACLAIAAVTAAVILFILFYNEPHGEWDAFAIWNLRARSLFRGGEQWRDAFSPSLSNADYPVLIPATVARVWTYLGSDSTLVPMVVALCFFSATVMLLGSTLSLLRSDRQAILASMLLLGSLPTLEHTAWQYADVPIGYFYLATLALLACHDRFAERRDGLLLFAGVMAGLATWTKNEGWLFLVSIALARLAVTVVRRDFDWKPAVPFAVGALPILALVTYFKLYLAPSSYLVAGQGWLAIAARVTDVRRYWEIAKAFIVEFGAFGGWLSATLLVYAVLMGRAPRAHLSRVVPAAAALCLMVGGFGATYLITPLGLTWQLSTSLSRLVVQLWPSILFVVFLFTATPEEVALVPVTRSDPARRNAAARSTSSKTAAPRKSQR